jgi:hypothetical protein
MSKAAPQTCEKSKGRFGVHLLQDVGQFCSKDTRAINFDNI